MLGQEIEESGAGAAADAGGAAGEGGGVIADAVELLGPWLGWLGALSAALFLISALLLPLLIVRLPADHFMDTFDGVPPRRSPAAHAARIVFGSFLIVAGILMIVLPGQGLFTIIAGLIVLDGPWRRWVERLALQRPSIVKSLDWLRERADREPFELPEWAARPPAEDQSNS